MKITNKIISLLLISLLITLSSCKKSTNTTNAIPKDTNFVMAFDTYSLIKKGKLNNIADFNFFNTIKKEVKNEDKKLAQFFDDVMENPAKTGFDFKKETFLYHINESKNEQFMSVLFNLTSDSKFTSFIEELIQKTGISKEIVKNNKYNYLELKRDVGLGWKNNKAILLTATNYKSRKHLEFEIETLLNQKAANSIKSNKEFNTFYNNKKDISLWLSTNLFEKMYGFDQVAREMNMDLSNNYISSHLNFNDDNIHLQTNFTPNKEFKAKLKENKIFDNTFNTSLLKFLPKEQLGVTSFAVNTNGYYNYMKDQKTFDQIEKEIKKELDLDIKDIMNAFGGSVIYSFFDVRNQMHTYKKYDYYSGEFKETEEEALTPIMSLAFDVKDKKIIEKLFAKLKEDEGKHFTKNGDFYEFKFDDKFPAYFAYNDKTILITNDDNSIKSFAKGGLNGANLSSSSLKSKIKSNHSFGYFKLNLEDYPIALRNEINKTNGRMTGKPLSIWNDFAKEVEFNQKKETSFDLTFKLKNDKNNSLYTILSTIDENYKSMLGF